MWSLNWHFVGYVQFAYCWQPLHIIDLLLNLRITLMIFGINKWILKFVSLDLVDIKFLNNNRWRIWFWRNQHFTDRGGVGGLLSNHRDLRVHHQSCLFHVQCHMYLFWSTGRHTVAIAFSAHSKTQQHLGLLALCGFGRAFIFLLSVCKNICQMVIGPLMSCSPGGGPWGREFIGLSWLCSGLD